MAGDYGQILKVKEDIEGQLRKLPNVHAVGIGKKVVGRKPTEELCIAVFVEHKLSPGNLTSEAIVPQKIAGIKTDVVEMGRPRLKVAANPANLVPTIAANQLSVTFSGANKPGSGLRILLQFTVTPGGAPANAVGRTSNNQTLNDVATALANAWNALGVTGITVAAAGAQVTVTAGAGFTVAINNCKVIAVDNARYFEDFIRGGIQIKLGGSSSVGTLGCLATTAPTPQDPKGKVVAITCHHVVEDQNNQATNLTVVTVGNQITFSQTGVQPIPLDTLVEVNFSGIDTDVFREGLLNRY